MPSRPVPRPVPRRSAPRGPLLALLAVALTALLGLGVWSALGADDAPPDPAATAPGPEDGAEDADTSEDAGTSEGAEEGRDGTGGTGGTEGADAGTGGTGADTGGSDAGDAATAPEASGVRPTLAFLGDSLTVGVGAGSGESYAWRTAEALGWPVAVVDGVSGSGYVARGAGLPFPDRVEALVATDPDVVVVVGGNNDIFQGLPVDEVRDAARDVFTALREGLPDADVVVVGPFPNRLDEVADPTAIRTSLESAAAQSGVTWLDPRDLLAEELADPSAWERYLSPDGVHPNADGYRLIGDALATRLPELVG